MAERCAPTILSLSLTETTPTLLPDRLREMAAEALRYAADPANSFDNNPMIAREWAAVSSGFLMLAQWLEQRLADIFHGG